MKRIAIVAVIALIHVVCGSSINDDPAIPCMNTTDCRTRNLPQNATCQNGICMCINERNITTQCSSLQAGAINHNKMPLIGRVCKLNNDCHFEHGICNTTNSQCTCMKGYVPSSDKHSCIEELSLGSSCSTKAQCLVKIANSTCEKDTCTCVVGYHEVDGKCEKNIEFGQPCNNTHQCAHIDDAVCTEKMLCGCKNGTKINIEGKKCLPLVVKILEGCMEDAQCSSLSGTKCIDKKCQCVEHQHFAINAKGCIISRVVGDSCNSAEECYQGEKEDEPKALQCLNKYCACADGYNQQDLVCTKGGASFVKSSVFVMLLTSIVCGLFA